MSSYELRKVLTDLQRRLETMSDFRAELAEIGKITQLLGDTLADFMPEQERVVPKPEISKPAMIRAQELINLIDSLSARRIFESIDQAKRAVFGFEESASIEEIENAEHALLHNTLTASLYKRLERFANAFDAYISNRTRAGAYRVGRAADTVSETWATLLRLAEEVNEIGGVGPRNDTETKSLEVYFDSIQAPLDVARKLTALQSMYSEICQLLGVDESSYPLMIEQLEVGSVFIKLTGAIGAIVKLGKLIEVGGGFLYRNYTNEGRVSATASQAESIRAVLKLSDELEARGVDSREVRSRAASAAQRLAANLDSLLTNERSIELDTRRYTVDENEERLLTAAPRRLLLNSGEADTDVAK